MNQRYAGCLSLTLCLMPVCAAAQDDPHIVVVPSTILWGPASPKLPPGARMSILVGDPPKPGELYVFRAQLPDGYSVPPHFHPMDEHVTVLEGAMLLGFGDERDDASMRVLPAGSYVRLPRSVPHYNRMQGRTVLQFHGVGPYDITYVNPTDDPTAIQN